MKIKFGIFSPHLITNKYSAILVTTQYKTFIQFFTLISIGFFLSSCGVMLAPERLINNQSVNHKRSFGIPYRVQSQIYYPLKTVGSFHQEGIASWYGQKFHGKETSNKEIYNMNALTAAHKTLPFDTQVQVINLENGKKVKVRINDRGPFVNNRIIDLSYAAAQHLEMAEKGIASVRLTVLNPTAKRLKNTPTEAKVLKYSVQIGLFHEKLNARIIEQSIPGSRIDSVLQTGDRFYRVLIGHFDKYEKALDKMDWLRLQGYPNAFIVTQ